jgi:hypothetical protein
MTNKTHGPQEITKQQLHKYQAKFFLPAAFRFTVSLQQKRAKRQSSCSSFFPLVGHTTSPQSFTHKNKNNSKKPHTNTQTDTQSCKESLSKRKKDTNSIAEHKRTTNQSIATAVRFRTPPKTENFRNRSNSVRKAQNGKEKHRETYTHTPNTEINMQLPVHLLSSSRNSENCPPHLPHRTPPKKNQIQGHQRTDRYLTE